ncbi:chaperone modulator CbpM [Methylomagnum sp.]
MAERSKMTAKGVLLDERTRFSLVELCEVCRISADYVLEVVDEGIIEPEGGEPAQWRFRAADLRRVQTALRLQRDLRVNLPGAALALHLLEELDATRRLVRESLFN